MHKKKTKMRYLFKVIFGLLLYGPLVAQPDNRTIEIDIVEENIERYSHLLKYIDYFIKNGKLDPEGLCEIRDEENNPKQVKKMLVCYYGKSACAVSQKKNNQIPIHITCRNNMEINNILSLIKVCVRSVYRRSMTSDIISEGMCRTLIGEKQLMATKNLWILIEQLAIQDMESIFLPNKKIQKIEEL